MAEDVQTWLKASTLAARARAMVEGLSIPAWTASSGTYQSPVRSTMLQACDELPAEGMAKGKHLIALAAAFERVRRMHYATASSGLYERGDRHLPRAIGRLFQSPESFVKPTTWEKAEVIFRARYYGQI